MSRRPPAGSRTTFTAAWWVGAAVTALLLAGCGGASGVPPAEGAPPEPSGPGTPASASPEATDAADSGIWATDPEDFNEADVEELDHTDVVFGEPDESDGLEDSWSEGEGDVPSTREIATDDPDGLPPWDPCSLVDLAAWEAIAGTSGRSVTLEGGDVCGYLAEGDRVRLAVGAFAWTDGPRWATGVDAFKDVGDGVLWAEGYPVPESSTLVMELPAWDVVFEMSHRDVRTSQEIRAALLPLADTAVDRVPR